MVAFKDPPKYKMSSCENYFATFTNMPAEETRVWTITKTSTSLALVCNGVEIFNYLFSESNRGNCMEHWSADMGLLKFWSDSQPDTASDKYRSKPTGNPTLAAFCHYKVDIVEK